ncbi:MAG TPA: VOC family protein [Pyrinomonadaceae bacterium]|jgi:predicted enzyme related to lactoylglutathione lyase|nr:VOC family protein [Pyrinomonadaceae bacterium]
MPIENAIASVAVKDLKTSVAWYQALLGKAPDSLPMPEVAEWNFPRGGWLQVYQLPERAGNCSCTLSVSNLEEVVEKAQQLGIDTSEQAASAQAKTLMIVDPDGNHIAIAQTLDKTMAR